MATEDESKQVDQTVDALGSEALYDAFSGIYREGNVEGMKAFFEELGQAEKIQYWHLLNGTLMRSKPQGKLPPEAHNGYQQLCDSLRLEMAANPDNQEVIRTLDRHRDQAFLEAVKIGDAVTVTLMLEGAPDGTRTGWLAILHRRLTDPFRARRISSDARNGMIGAFNKAVDSLHDNAEAMEFLDGQGVEEIQQEVPLGDVEKALLEVMMRGDEDALEERLFLSPDKIKTRYAVLLFGIVHEGKHNSIPKDIREYAGHLLPAVIRQVRRNPDALKELGEKGIL